MTASLRVRVYYEDTDASGVAYHESYLRWLERGRTEWFRGLGFDQERLMRDEQAAFTLATASVRVGCVGVPAFRPRRIPDPILQGLADVG